MGIEKRVGAAKKGLARVELPQARESTRPLGRRCFRVANTFRDAYTECLLLEDELLAASPNERRRYRSRLGYAQHIDES